MLGHEVPFSYCRAPARHLPCGKVLDCWYEAFDVEGFLRAHFTEAEISEILRPRQDKMVTLVELIERALRNSSKSRDTVLDPFGGSGTTLIACERTGRQARLIELDPKYCDVIVQRYQDHCGNSAVLEGDGRSFVGIAEDRGVVAA